MNMCLQVSISGNLWVCYGLLAFHGPIKFNLLAPLTCQIQGKSKQEKAGLRSQAFLAWGTLFLCTYSHTLSRARGSLESAVFRPVLLPCPASGGSGYRLNLPLRGPEPHISFTHSNSCHGSSSRKVLGRSGRLGNSMASSMPTPPPPPRK